MQQQKEAGSVGRRRYAAAPTDARGLPHPHTRALTWPPPPSPACAQRGVGERVQHLGLAGHATPARAPQGHERARPAERAGRQRAEVRVAGWLAGGGTGTPLWGSAGDPAGLCRSCPTRDPGPATGPRRTLFNIGKESKIGAGGVSIRSNLAVRRGDGKDVVYRWVGVGAGCGACVCVLGLGLAKVAACGWRGTRRERSTLGGGHGAAFCGDGHSARGCLPAPAQDPARPDGADAADRRRAERRAGVLRVQEHQGPDARSVSPPSKITKIYIRISPSSASF